MKQIGRYAGALWESDWLWQLVMLAGFTYAIGWAGFTIGVAAILVRFIWEARAVAEDAPCAKCRHRKDDHHGNCQACLRDDLHGALSGSVPCSRFARGPIEKKINA